MEPIRVRFVEHGPFRGRCYQINDDGTTGRRRPDLEPRATHASTRDKAELAALVQQIPDQEALNAVLADVSTPQMRDALIAAWRPYLRFEPHEPS